MQGFVFYINTKQVDKIYGFKVELRASNIFWHANTFNSDKESEYANARTG